MRAVKGSLGHSSKERYRELEDPRWKRAEETLQPAFDGEERMRAVRDSLAALVRACRARSHNDPSVFARTFYFLRSASSIAV
jgi:hypothetical protein